MHVLELVGVAVAAALLTLAIAGAGQRIRTARDTEWFRCRVRRYTWRGGGTLRWSRRSTRARWVNDVLLVQVGALRMRTRALHMTLPAGSRMDVEVRCTVRRRHGLRHSLRLVDSDGRPHEFAVRGDDRTRLVGPFLAAAIPGLPAAPPQRRPGR